MNKDTDTTLLRVKIDDRDDFKVIAATKRKSMQELFAEIVKKLKHGGRV